MKTNRLSTRSAAISAAVAVALSGASHAQNASDDLFVLQEVVVTAQKREQNLQIVPISVSAFTSADIEQRSLQNVGEILATTPNVMRASGPSTGDDGFFFFRGVGQVDNSANVEPGVGVYIDEVYLGRVQGASFDVLDIERIEILRGPQGTLFGRNTIGGAVNATTRDPGDELGAKARLVVGDRDHIDAQLSVDAPLTDTFGMLASVFTRNQDGWAENIRTGQTYGDREDIGGRVKFVWEPSESFEAKLAADYNEGKGTAIPTALLATLPAMLPIGPGGALVPYFGSPLLVDFPADTNTEIDTRPHDDRVYGSIDPDMESERSGASLHLRWDAGPIELKSITSFRQTEQTAPTDLDGTSYVFYDFLFGVDQDQFSQEFQLAGTAADEKLHWLAGVYYYTEDLLNTTEAGVGTNGGLLGFGPPVAPGAPPTAIVAPAQRLDGRQLRFLSNFYQETTSYAGFGQVDYAFTERLTGIVGFRYTEDEKDVSLDNASDNRDGVFSPVCQLIPFPPGQRVCAPAGGFFYTASNRPGSEAQIAGLNTTFNDTWSEFSPKLGLNFNVSDDVMTYVSWSNAFKSGGFQGRATPGNDTPDFEPETVETYEIGIKSELADRRVRLNAAAFFTKYEDTQILVGEVVNGTPNFVTRNAGDSEIKGVEVELLTRPSANFDLSASVGWMDNEYTRLHPGAAAFNIGLDDSLPMTPEWTGALGAQYRWTLGDAGTLALRGDYSYRSEFSFQAANNPNDIQDAYGLLDLRATWMSPSGALSVAAFGRNVTDEGYFTSLSDQRFGGNLGVSLGTLAPPRDYGLEVGYRF